MRWRVAAVVAVAGMVAIPAIGEACPAIVPRPRLVGTFSFRVTRG